METDKSLESLKLRHFTIRRLKKAGITTINQLLKCTRKQLLSYRLNLKQINEIQKRLLNINSNYYLGSTKVIDKEKNKKILQLRHLLEIELQYQEAKNLLDRQISIVTKEKIKEKS